MVGGAWARVAAVINGQVDFTMVTDSGKIQGERAGLKVIIDMAKLKIPFQFTCTVTTKCDHSSASPNGGKHGQVSGGSRAFFQEPTKKNPSKSCRSIPAGRNPMFSKARG